MQTKLILIAALILIPGCLEIGHQPSDVQRPPRWEPTPIKIDCGPLPATPGWSAHVDDAAGVAVIPVDQWMDLATWIAAVEDWRTCIAAQK